MSLPKRYNPKTAEPALQTQWQADGTYHFEPNSDAPVFSIDTPPPSVSGHLHLGHVYSYSQTDFIARFFRMNGRNLFYPMGFDDNGLPTEQLVERLEKVRAPEIGRQAFIDLCLKVSEETEGKYRALWQRLGLSVDWRYTYRTIDDNSRRLAQWSFLELHRKGLAYRQKAPAIWCPECQTAIAQAELNDLERDSTFYTLAFTLEDGTPLPIATTRPELLPACVAVFVHPEDGRFTPTLGQMITTPYTHQQVPLLADPAAEPEKGTGAVMCCTFGDNTDVTWWRTHDLPLIEAIGADGRLTNAVDPHLAGHTTAEARQIIIEKLKETGELLGEEKISQHVRTHERCDTPVEYRVVSQWFIRLLDFKDELLAQGEKINWQPAHMKLRYRQWVENLAWDWCISRQRFFGVPFPVWTCAQCGETVLADEANLPVDPLADKPSHPCPNCQSTEFIPEADVMDTWATSSLSPQIVGQWPENEALYQQTYPFSLRPQAHEIIRTWAFYTIAKSWLHFGTLPFESVAISGWGLAPVGEGKISKSKKSSVIGPLEMIERYSADAVRYWAASTALGKDAIISEEKIQAGAKLVNKLWHVARFCSRFLGDQRLEIRDSQSAPISSLQSPVSFTLADRWLLAHTQRLIEHTTKLYEQYDYATAKSEIEHFFWQILADNYLEMAKLRLYDGGVASEGAQYALHHALLTTLKLLAPILPFVTEQIYQGLFAKADNPASDGATSIHTSAWPRGDEAWRDDTAVTHGNQLVEIATAVRRYKSEQNLSLGAELASLHLHTSDAELATHLQTAITDLSSITRAKEIVLDGEMEGELVGNGRWQLSIQAEAK